MGVVVASWYSTVLAAILGTNVAVVLLTLHLTQEGEPIIPTSLQHSRMPRQILQTYFKSDLPALAESAVDTWRSNNVDWHYMLFNDSEIDAFMHKQFDRDTYEVFKSFPVGVMRADMWRYAALYKLGGVYTDVDTICKRPIDDWLPPSCDVVFSVEDREGLFFCQWSMASVPGHPLLKQVLDLIVQRAKAGIDASDECFVHYHTGPALWTDAIRDMLGMPANMTAKEMFARGRDRMEVIQQQRICIVPWQWFKGRYVKNQIGSSHYGKDYRSWRVEATAFRDSVLGRKTHKVRC